LLRGRAHGEIPAIYGGLFFCLGHPNGVLNGVQHGIVVFVFVFARSFPSLLPNL
jgi:hypothetical protein